jgi:hypothetical protein
VICDEGYQSSLAAATLQRFGFTDATDVIGGFQASKAAGFGVHDPPNGCPDADPSQASIRRRRVRSTATPEEYLTRRPATAGITAWVAATPPAIAEVSRRPKSRAIVAVVPAP